MIIVVMGVSGSGKSTVGSLLAERLGCAFADADDLHPPENRARMAAGIALTDDDRKPWLRALHELLREWIQAGRSGVLACSALRSSYRDALRDGLPADQIHFALLEGPRALIAERLSLRTGHFMPPSLLDSQLETLEVEDVRTVVSIAQTPQQVADEIMRRLGLGMQMKGVQE